MTLNTNLGYGASVHRRLVRRIAALAAAGALSVVLAACSNGASGTPHAGGDETGDVTVVVTSTTTPNSAGTDGVGASGADESAPASSAQSSSAESSSAQSSSAQSETQSSSAQSAVAPSQSTAPAANPAIDITTGFRSPSGNITCRAGSGVDDELSCGIRSFSYQPDAVGCGDDGPTEWKFGQLLTLDGGHPVMACSGNEPTASADAVLQYGQSTRNERYGCRSEKGGVTCVDLLHRTGFQLSQSKFTRLDSTAVEKLGGFPKSSLDTQLVEIYAIGDGSMTVRNLEAIPEGYDYAPGSTKKQIAVSPDAEIKSIGQLCEHQQGLNPITHCDVATAAKMVAGDKEKPAAEAIGIDGKVVLVRQLWRP